MAACTYPNHASFITGAPPADHGIFANHVVAGGKAAGAWEVGPRVPTLFDRYTTDACAVLGDHHLVAVMGAEAAGSHWPPAGRLPEGIDLDPLGYPADAAVLPVLLSGIADQARLVVGYLGSIDTYSHLFGPDSPEALAAYVGVDGQIAAIEEALAWDDTVVIVVSDHIQNTVDDRPGIDLRGEAGEDTVIADEGSATLIGATCDLSTLANVDGVVDAVHLADGNTLAWCEPGRFFGPFESPIFRGVHGNEATRTQLALVTGGHPSRHFASDLVNAGPVPATAWAGLITQLLG